MRILRLTYQIALFPSIEAAKLWINAQKILTYLYFVLFSWMLIANFAPPYIRFWILLERIQLPNRMAAFQLRQSVRVTGSFFIKTYLVFIIIHYGTRV